MLGELLFSIEQSRVGLTEKMIFGKGLEEMREPLMPSDGRVLQLKGIESGKDLRVCMVS